MLCKKEKSWVAKSIIPATAQEYEALIWTQDSDLKNMDKVKHFSQEMNYNAPPLVNWSKVYNNSRGEVDGNNYIIGTIGTTKCEI